MTRQRGKQNEKEKNMYTSVTRQAASIAAIIVLCLALFMGAFLQARGIERAHPSQTGIMLVAPASYRQGAI